MNPTIVIVDSIPHAIQYTQSYFASVMIVSSRMSYNLQSLEFRNQNPAYDILYGLTQKSGQEGCLMKL